MPGRRDRDLGMDRAITRRDFLNGVAVALTHRARRRRGWSARRRTQPPAAAGIYPPALTGMRGSHDGSYEVAHRLRDGPASGRARARPPPPASATTWWSWARGLSGLAAAHLFRKAAGPTARILILDNHDDFGGHAAPQRVHARAAARCSATGAASRSTAPRPTARAARALVRELGVDVGALVLGGRRRALFLAGPAVRRSSSTRRPSARTACCQSRPRRARARARTTSRPSAKTPGRGSWPRPRCRAAARPALLRLMTESRDYLPGLAADAKKARLARMSYADFLTGPAGCAAGPRPLLPGPHPHPLRRRHRRGSRAGRLGPRPAGLRRAWAWAIVPVPA